MKPKLYYLGKPEDGFGWGIANTNIVRALGEFCEVVVDTSARDRFDAPTFVPISDSDLNPIRRVLSPRTIGYCFTEWPITEKAKRNARQYDLIFAGSTWNVQRLAEKGIASEVLHQGIDFNRFVVQPPCERKGFVVFSGGKYEFRKGQDYVIAAMRCFMNVRKDVVLLTAWANQWAQSVATMDNSWLLDTPATENTMKFGGEFEQIPQERIIRLPLIPNEKTPGVYAQSHIGVFPNRCEAGTNLVMCEYMASGRPVIATDKTGHADVFEGGNIQDWLLSNGSHDCAGWFNPNVADIIAQLEFAYQHKDQLPALGLECRRLVEKFTWRNCAEKIFMEAFPLNA